VTSDVERAIDELYGVPPKEFAGARNARAAALKAAGRASDAQAVRRLAKPSPFLWATNQLARHDPARVAHFIDVVHRVRESQLRDPRTAAEGMQTIRAELLALTSRARELLTAAGYRVDPAGAARISNTVLGAAVDAGLVEDLRRGRLTAELAAPGFEVLAGAEPDRTLRLVRGGKSVGGVRGLAERAREAAALVPHDTRRAREEAKRARDEARRAQVEAERARRAQEADAHRREAEQRAAQAARAADEVRELERRLADARRLLRSAQRDAAAAADRARRHRDS
jgi:hypothetical protein